MIMLRCRVLCWRVFMEQLLLLVRPPPPSSKVNQVEKVDANGSRVEMGPRLECRILPG